MIAIKRWSSQDADFKARLDALLAFESAQDESVDRTVAAILADVKVRGDNAVVEYTNRFDRLNATSLSELELSREALQAALDGFAGGAAHGTRNRRQPCQKLSRTPDGAELAI